MMSQAKETPDRREMVVRMSAEERLALGPPPERIIERPRRNPIGYYKIIRPGKESY
jgi:hypothetical protein